MEDVLEVYQRPHDPACPVVCLDEATKQLIKETRVPIPAKPGQPARHDYEYERNRTANLFMMFAPLEGWRHVKATDRHTAAGAQGPVRHSLPVGDQDCARAGQSEYPQAGLTLRSLPRCRGKAARRAVRVALHAQTRQLVGYG